MDLHLHTTASDGSLSPQALVHQAQSSSLSVIAITDHDTSSGIESGAAAASLAGIGFVAGIEFSIEWDEDGEFHLLGLGITKPSSAFLTAVEELSSRRERRNHEIIHLIREAGITVTYDEVVTLAGGSSSVGRPHFAKLLVERSFAAGIEDAFNNWLGRGKPFYVKKCGLDFTHAAAVIRESGGIAVLAHPRSLHLGSRSLKKLLKNLKTQGLDGVEAWHPTAGPSYCSQLSALSSSLGLLVTAGSDFHGNERVNRFLGRSAGGREIDETLVSASFLEVLPSLLSDMR